MADRYLVLGSNSFSGASFVETLLLSDCELLVEGISRSKEPNEAFLPYKSISGFENRFNFHQLDLNNDIDEIVNVIKLFKPNYIVNFAAQGMVAQSWENPSHWYNTNVLSLLNLVDSIYKLDFIERFIQVSTPEVYGPCDNIRESRCYSPSSPYAASKASADVLLHAYFSTQGFPICFTRASNVFGPYQQLYRIIPRAIFTIMNNEKIPLHGGGRAVRSFIHIKDVAKATIKIAKNGESGEIYHLSDSKSIKIFDLVAMISRSMGMSIDECCYEVPDRLGQDSKYLLNSDKIEEDLKWKPTITLEQGIEQTIEWVEKNFSYLKTIPLDYIHKK